MKTRYALILMLAVGYQSSNADDVKIFVLAGASNIYGQGFATDVISPYDVPQDDVWIWQDDLGDNVGWTALQPGFGATTNNFASGGTPNRCNASQERQGRCGNSEFGPELSLGRFLADAFPEHQIAILKHSRGGGDLVTHWNPANEWNSTNAGPPDIDHMYAGLTAKIEKATDALVEDNLDYEVAGFFWEQGGGDARDIDKANAYAANLTNLIASFRDDFADENMPFVIGRKNIATLDRHTYLETIRDSQIEVADADPFGSWVSIDDLTVRSPTDAHLNAEGQVDLGIRFANAYLSVLGIEFCNPNTMGDLDGNTKVDFADFLILSANFGKDVASHELGDIDCNGTVEFADFLTLSSNFGSIVQGAETVPEPNGHVVLASALMLISIVRRHRS